MPVVYVFLVGIIVVSLIVGIVITLMDKKSTETSGEGLSDEEKERLYEEHNISKSMVESIHNEEPVKYEDSSEEEEKLEKFVAKKNEIEEEKKEEKEEEIEIL